MSKLPRDVSGADAIKALKKVDYQLVRQKGPHVILEGRDGRLIVVPLHRRLKTGLLRAIIKEAGLSVEEFTELLKDPQPNFGVSINEEKAQNLHPRHQVSISLSHG